MDKQIIIDCVNVSEWTDGEVYYKLEHYSPKATKQIAFDLYKQLKAKEQECEELNKWLPIVTRLEVAFGSIETEKTKSIDYNTYAVKIFRQLDQLEEENKELRQLLSKEPLALQALQRAYSSYKKSTDVFYKMAKDYKQALAEIKEIAMTGLEGFCPKCSRKECEDNNCIETAIRDILQKISEVIDVS